MRLYSQRVEGIGEMFEVVVHIEGVRDLFRGETFADIGIGFDGSAKGWCFFEWDWEAWERFRRGTVECGANQMAVINQEQTGAGGKFGGGFDNSHAPLLFVFSLVYPAGGLIHVVNGGLVSG